MKKIDKTLIIAEAGVNHNGSLIKAKELIDVAVEAGADYVKFQTFTAETLAIKKAEKAEYQKNLTSLEESQFEMLKKLELDIDTHQKLIEHCRVKGIAFMSTPFDISDIKLLKSFDLPFYKIPSGELTNLLYLRFIGGLGKPIILSTGMGSLKEIESAIRILQESGMKRKQITVLHCNTAYPTPMIDVNLKAMVTIRKLLDVKVGYSDHTLGIEIPIAAVALGAKVIEKHFTLDRKLPGPDHAASLEPRELKSMISAIRNIEQAMGDGEKYPSASEIKNIHIARKSIVAKKTIRKGESLTKENLTIKRPGNGVSPMKWDNYIGKLANKEYQIDDLIERIS